jgi:hypothetical protein
LELEGLSVKAGGVLVGLHPAIPVGPEGLPVTQRRLTCGQQSPCPLLLNHDRMPFIFIISWWQLRRGELSITAYFYIMHGYAYEMAADGMPLVGDGIASYILNVLA